MSVADMIIAEAMRQGVSPQLAIEVASRESNLNPDTPDGGVGEIGVFQIRPSTAPGVDLRDLATNIQTGVSILRQMLSLFGDPAAAVAAYNCGQGCVQRAMSKYGKDWFSFIPSSTQGYVQAILGNVQSQYSVSLNPAPAPPPFVASGSTLNIPTVQAGFLPTASGSLWTTLAVAFAVILGIGYVLSED